MFSWNKGHLGGWCKIYLGIKKRYQHVIGGLTVEVLRAQLPKSCIPKGPCTVGI